MLRFVGKLCNKLGGEKKENIVSKKKLSLQRKFLEEKLNLEIIVIGAFNEIFLFDLFGWILEMFCNANVIRFT